MRRVIERRLLSHFGLAGMPEYHSAVTRQFLDDVKHAVFHNQMLVLSGEVGMGKSMLFRDAVAQSKELVTYVFVRNFFKEKLTIANILNAIIYELGNGENPRRDLEARSTQCVRMMGGHKFDTNKSICLVIEEAHRLHANTLRAMKELREAEFRGVSPLFSVVLIGHPALVEKMQSRREASLRSHFVALTERNGWMTLRERIAYLSTVFGGAIEQSTRRRIAAFKFTPLEMDDFVEATMRKARELNKKVIDEQLVQPTNRELREAYGLSLAQIAEEAGLAKSTVHDAINNDQHRDSKAVRTAMEKLQARHSSGQRKVG